MAHMLGIFIVKENLINLKKKYGIIAIKRTTKITYFILMMVRILMQSNYYEHFEIIVKSLFVYSSMLL